MGDLEFADGPFFFPVTPFDLDGAVADAALAEHIDAGVRAGAGAVFAACGTGEFHALSVSEHRSVVTAAVSATGGRVPVIAGSGGPIGHAIQTAENAREAGAEALLVMPPYLVQGPQSGIVTYIEVVAAAAQVPVIAYHRGNAQLTSASAERLFDNPLVVGVKDGVGDVAVMQQIVLAGTRSGRELLFFNGLLTAEMSQAAYRAIGVPLYSSAVFAMAPDIATAFYRAYTAQDVATQNALLDGFFSPLVKLRDEVPGFAVSLIKAGLRISGHAVGGVRAPLVDPTPEQEQRLAALLDHGRSLL